MSSTPVSRPVAGAAVPGPDSTGQPEERGRGLALTASAYLLWGAMPLYFALLVPAGPFEIVAHRVVWSLVLCVLLLGLLGGLRRRRGGSGPWATVAALSLRSWLLLGAAGLLIATNWVLYVVAVNSGHVVEAALGYFINPVFSVVLGVVFLSERLSPARWTAVGVSLAAVLVLAIGYGQPPWLSLGLACSFGLYGLVKKTVPTDAVTSLTVETAWLTPLALVTLLVMAPSSTFTGQGPGHTALLVLLGAVTTVPLLCFGAGARRIPLSLVGMLQNLTPVLQLLIGVLLFDEQMPPVRLVGFALVWLALTILMVDVLVRSRTRRRRAIAARTAPPG